MIVSNDLTIKASPTKDLFITMLVRDIPLINAILDLVDNSVDGAIRQRPNGNYEGLYVRIEAKPGYFMISDNCGGIPLEIAKNYAFRFGRPKGMTSTPHSIGQFGVGMKRALFKIGGFFTIESITKTEKFTMEVDVDKWKEDEEDWNFTFKNIETLTNPTPETEQGTTITISKLHIPISREFELENFQTRLKNEFESKLQIQMKKGLTVTLNHLPLNFKPSRLLRSEEIEPGYWEDVVTYPEKSPINIKMWAGISESKPSFAGWYVFCNGRLILEADQTGVTGWGEGDETTIPKYHNQYARFRGYVFFDSNDAGLLPWNTTKTGVDADSEIYRHIKQEMIILMRPVIDFLNKLKEEEQSDEKPLSVAIQSLLPLDINPMSSSNVTDSPRVFTSPQAVKVKSTSRIQYDRQIEQIEKAKKKLNAKSYKEVGEKTFEYFYERECEE